MSFDQWTSIGLQQWCLRIGQDKVHDIDDAGNNIVGDIRFDAEQQHAVYRWIVYRGAGCVHSWRCCVCSHRAAVCQLVRMSSSQTQSRYCHDTTIICNSKCN